MKIETAGHVEIIPEEAAVKPEALEKVQESIRLNADKIHAIELLTDDEAEQKMKSQRVERLIRQKSRTLAEIKEACERIDAVKLYSGKEIQGAIIRRGDNYSILTTTGVVEVPKKEIRSTSVIR